MKTFLIVSGSLLFSSAAFANPIMAVQELRAEVVAGPHVKLTYTYNVSSPPAAATINGTSHSPWVQTGTTSRNTGSGAQNLPILQMCDCHVPSGTTLYYLPLTATGLGIGSQVQVQVPSTPPTAVGCVTECERADAEDAGARDAPVATDVIPLKPDVSLDRPPTVDVPLSMDGYPDAGVPLSTGGVPAVDAPIASGGSMTVDAPVSTGGTIAPALDAASGNGGVTATGGASSPTGGTLNATGGTTSATQGKSGGCNFQASTNPSGLSLLALLGLSLCRLRRRS